MNSNERSSKTVISTGMIVPASCWVRALNALQNSMMLTPCWPSAGPTGGAGFAAPAGIWSLIRVRTFFAMSGGRGYRDGLWPPRSRPLVLDVAARRPRRFAGADGTYASSSRRATVLRQATTSASAIEDGSWARQISRNRTPSGRGCGRRGRGRAGRRPGDGGGRHSRPRHGPRRCGGLPIVNFRAAPAAWIDVLERALRGTQVPRSMIVRGSEVRVDARGSPSTSETGHPMTSIPGHERPAPVGETHQCSSHGRARIFPAVASDRQSCRRRDRDERHLRRRNRCDPAPVHDGYRGQTGQAT